MKPTYLIILFMLLAVKSIFPSFGGMYIVYSVERYPSEGIIKELPEYLVLVPKLMETSEINSFDEKVEYILKELKKQKPDLYLSVKEIPGKDYRNRWRRNETIVFEVGVTDEDSFRIVMSELVYSTNSIPSFGNRPIKFIFKNKKLQNKYSNRIFEKKDVVIPAFEINSK